MFPWFRPSAYKISLPSNCLHLYTTFFAHMQGTTINKAETKLCHLFYSQKFFAITTTKVGQQCLLSSNPKKKSFTELLLSVANSFTKILLRNNNRNEVEIFLKPSRRNSFAKLLLLLILPSVFARAYLEYIQHSSISSTSVLEFLATAICNTQAGTYIFRNVRADFTLSSMRSQLKKNRRRERRRERSPPAPSPWSQLLLPKSDHVSRFLRVG